MTINKMMKQIAAMRMARLSVTESLTHPFSSRIHKLNYQIAGLIFNPSSRRFVFTKEPLWNTLKPQQSLDDFELVNIRVIKARVFQSSRTNSRTHDLALWRLEC